MNIREQLLPSHESERPQCSYCTGQARFVTFDDPHIEYYCRRCARSIYYANLDGHTDKLHPLHMRHLRNYLSRFLPFQGEA